MRDCQEILDSLFDYIDKEMTGKDASEIKAHLELCRSCFDRAEFERILRLHFQEKTNHVCPQEVKTRIQKLIEDF